MKKKILIIDDDTDLRTLLAMFLQEGLADFSIIQAEDGLDGLTKIQEHSPSIVICDNQMPRMKGIDLVQALNNKNIRVPHFFLHTGDAIPPKAILHGRPVEIWPKPQDVFQMIKSIQTLKL